MVVMEEQCKEKRVAKKRINKGRISIGSGLGELEIEILSVIWKLDSALVTDVFKELYPEKKLAYTTIMTVMSRLANKGILSQSRKSKAFIYTPNISREDMARFLISKIVDKVLDGDKMIALQLLINKSEIEGSDLGEIAPLTQKMKEKEIEASEIHIRNN